MAIAEDAPCDQTAHPCYRTFKNGEAEMHAIRSSALRLCQYLYVQESDETPSTINRKDKELKTAQEKCNTRAIALFVGPHLGVSTSMCQNQSKVLQSCQKYSMLFQDKATKKFSIVTGEPVNWLQLCERMYARPSIVSQGRHWYVNNESRSISVRPK